MDPVLSEGQLQVVEPADARLPEMDLFQSDRQLHLSRGIFRPGFAHGAALIEGLGRKGRFALQPGGQHQQAFLRVGLIVDAPDMDFGRGFQPHRLPDAGGPGIDAAVGVGLRALLAGRDHGIPGIVGGKQGDHILTGGHQGRDIEFEGQEAASVGAGLLAVDPDRGRIVHGAEMEVHPAGTLLPGQVHPLLIPHAVEEVLMPHSGQVALRAEGDGDGALQHRVFFVQLPVFSGTGLIHLEGPGAVEVHPAVPPELRLGMFTARDHSASLLFCFRSAAAR